MNLQKESEKVRNSMSTQQSVGLNSFKSSNKIKSMRNIRVCRICLEQSDVKILNSTLIKPCRCSGSLQFVHQQCLIEWLNTMITRRLELGEPLEQIHCEICKEELDIEYRKKIVCREKQNLKDRVKVYWPYLAVNIFLMLFIIGGMGVLAYFHFTTKPNTEADKKTLLILYSLGWAILGVAFIVWTIKLFKNFLLRSRVYVAKIQQKQFAIQIQPQPQPILDLPKPQANQPSSIQQPSQSENALVRRKLKVIPIRPAFKNQSLDCLGSDQLNQNSQPIGCC